MWKLIIYYESAHGVTATLVTFETHAELLACTAIIDNIDEGPISYLELQEPPAGIKQPYLEGTLTTDPDE